MTDQPADPVSPPTPRTGSFLGGLTGLGVALIYGLTTELVGLTFGLVAIGFFGGWAIGGAVGYGTWRGADHPTIRALRVIALVIAVSSWLLGLVVAFTVSQVLLPEASTPLLERLTLSGLVAYLGGTFDALGLFHLAALAAAAVMAWRGAR